MTTPVQDVYQEIYVVGHFNAKELATKKGSPRSWTKQAHSFNLSRFKRSIGIGFAAKHPNAIWATEATETVDYITFYK